MQRFTIALLVGRLKNIKNLLRDSSVALWKKALMVFAMVYLVSPVDLIPPLVPVFGFFDDFVLWGVVIYLLWDELGKYGDPEPAAQSVKKKKFHGKNVVDGVEFEVKVEEQDKEENGNA